MKNETKENIYNRNNLLEKIRDKNCVWDVLVIGGGATGLGVALDAASRGYKTLLLEQSDFAKGTSSRSTKLVHGGVRYLAQGNIKLVLEALYERGLMMKNAPHLVNPLPFIIPSYRWWEKFFYGFGLKIYDWMAGKLRVGSTRLLNKDTVTKEMGNLKHNKLNGGVAYYDGQFDDARLAINLAQTSIENGGVLLNYVKVSKLLKDHEGKITGVEATDCESGELFKVNARIVINATGVFVDDILKLDDPNANALVKVSQGIHLVVERSFLKGDSALMIPATSDGRVLFAVPWHDHLLVGTTDTPLDRHQLEPKALTQEVEFILDTLKEYLDKAPTREDVLSVFAGLRPLVLPEDKEKGTKEISRDHKLKKSKSGLITITGGKWTTYRRMAEDTVDMAIKTATMEYRPCVTKNLKIHGFQKEKNTDTMQLYGSDAGRILELENKMPELKKKLYPDFPYTMANVVWAVRYEMARTIDDVLARRLRILFLDAKAAVEMAPMVASIMAKELVKDKEWEKAQTLQFLKLSKNYMLNPSINNSAEKIDQPVSNY
ncbi:glycerol-3-phosphate dehydrogenase/oxidase [Galbibacter pacificus]|uniref:Glycerol-3-phosphate dehydrogenase/oxidase n=1 Tax=Galbibacter pacificus TaxID=2996052 RepID=A0ABT6FMV9_9FLAO|nr:glycerol-3-phosphate dehydrogenase/oxidase [Galbibacter pacificus]MDG3581121.1 glycerol-3-phosphate dehydrogenase/oxidase [Galbibacter pacificus]MDG3584599.1 glycerol-3-phosphate dehydrogenase/oxidase [Galbibacter pacificus]